MKEILIATNNQGKVKEIKEILKDYKLLTLKDVNDHTRLMYYDLYRLL